MIFEKKKVSKLELKIIKVIFFQMEQFGFRMQLIMQKKWQTLETLIRLLLRSSLIWVHNICSGLSVPILRIFTINSHSVESYPVELSSKIPITYEHCSLPFFQGLRGNA